MRSRTWIIAAFGMLTACQRGGQRSGPLAAMADVALPASERTQCVKLPVLMKPDEPSDNGCEATIRDTARTVVTDSHGKVKAVRLVWHVNTPVGSESFETLSTHLAADFGKGEEACVDSATSRGLRWQTREFFVTLVERSTARSMELSRELGTPPLQTPCPYHP